MFIIILILAIVLGIAIKKYNALQHGAQAVRRQASNVQVSISKKLSLINQLIDVVKNFQEAEQFTQLKISQDNTAASLMNSYQQSGTTLASIQGLAQRFPDLKASDQYQRLMKNIEDCEVDIQNQRMQYNKEVEAYNNVRLGIPTIFIARSMGFTEAPYLQFDLSGMTDVTSLKEFKTDDGERLAQLLNSAGSSIKGATKTLANHAGQAGKLIADKVKEHTTTKYFYMTPGSTPKGPISKDEILMMRSNNTLTGEALISEAGSDDWKNIDMLGTDSASISNINEN